MSKSKLALSCAVFACALAVASPASATVTASAVAGCATYTDCGPTPITYDFDTTFPTTSPASGLIVGPGSQSGLFAQPLGSTGQYFSVGPSTTTPASIILGDNINSVSFIWGSVDSYNTLVVHTALGDTTFTGSYIASLIPGFADGNQTSPTSNPIVTLFFTGGDQQGVSLNMTSADVNGIGQNAFETDNYVINGVPEPATWAMMLLGFGAVGVSMRRRKSPLPQLA